MYRFSMEYKWNKIVAEYIATDDELRLVTCINGYNEDVLNDVIYVRTGYRTFEQYITNKHDEYE